VAPFPWSVVGIGFHCLHGLFGLALKRVDCATDLFQGTLFVKISQGIGSVSEQIVSGRFASLRGESAIGCCA